MDGIYEQLGIAEPEHEYAGQDGLDGKLAEWRDDAQDVESMQGAELEHVKMCQKDMLADKLGGRIQAGSASRGGVETTGSRSGIRGGCRGAQRRGRSQQRFFES